MMRKLLISALVLLMFPGLALADFPDVYPTNPYLDAINYVQAEGIVDGYPNGEYRPRHLINRAEFVKILVNTKYDESEINACTDPSSAEGLFIILSSLCLGSGWFRRDIDGWF